ncbi:MULTISPECIES: M23 family metallopeptidase [unclassified Paenibacillus]|uniref:M23 family metallopeptidase n=1 Tax=unclassified Paenibacillus TaxID=185978 RepID=UPI001C0F7182|nr:MULTISPECIES: M23 family metallopeptidase [unclassified Paenibacillus]MBU5444663.1 M23 family metallopeptidase [Paenibacillus sp. MSJ-34]CAH0119123.1 hypothetical protein PAE9249_01620 [Paenibacillus sp. CECT 9249]
MHIKDNVRERRQRKIRSLLESQPERQEEKTFPPRSNSAHRPISELPLSNAPEPDPEQVWKQQRNQLWNSPPAAGGGEDPETPERNGSSAIRSFGVKLAVCALLFAAVWGLFQVQKPWAGPAKSFIAQALTEEMNFQAIAAWYEQTFGGAPSFIPIFQTTDNRAEKANSTVAFVVPLDGSVVQSFAMTLKGIEIASSSSNHDYSVKAVDTGRVVQVSRDPELGLTVAIQHAGQYLSVYGRLGEAEVKVNDWVQAGHEIGTLSESREASGAAPMLYFALKKDGRYVDPADVIAFD